MKLLLNISNKRGQDRVVVLEKGACWVVEPVLSDPFCDVSLVVSNADLGCLRSGVRLCSWDNRVALTEKHSRALFVRGNVPKVQTEKFDVSVIA